MLTVSATTRHTHTALSAANVAWSRHLNEAHWHRLFDARWSHCYEGQCLTVSPSILSRLQGNYHSFWGTIEKARACMLASGDGRGNALISPM